MNNLKFNSEKFLQIIFFSLLLIWNLGILWEIIIKIFPDTVLLLPFLKNNYSIVCHTQEKKLFFIFDAHTLVCSRCFGIYIGGLLSSIILIFGYKKIISIKLLLLASLPMFVDVFLYGIRLYSYNQYIAFTTGLVLGIIGLIFFYQTLKELYKKN